MRNDSSQALLPTLHGCSLPITALSAPHHFVVGLLGRGTWNILAEYSKMFFCCSVLEEYALKCLQQKPLIWKSHFSLCLSQYRNNAAAVGWKISPGNSLLCLSLTSLD